MAKQTVKIPKPSNDLIVGWQRQGTGGTSLVWDRNRRSWSIKSANNVSGADITYEDWEAGEKSYSVTTGAGTTTAPEDVVTKEALARDPLAPFIDKYGLQVVTDPTRGTTYLQGFTVDPKTGKRSENTVPYYLYLDSKGKINLSSDYDAIKKAALDDLRTTGKLNNLFQDLYNKKLISKETYDAKNLQAADFNAALVGTINEYSKTVIGNRQFDPTQTQAPDFLSFLQTGIAGRGGGEANLPRREFQDISKEQLNAFIESIYLETIGRKPTEEQRAAKLKELNKIVRRGIVTTTRQEGGEIVTRSRGGFNESEQALKLQQQLKQENPLEYERRQAFDFMDELQKIMSGGM